MAEKLLMKRWWVVAGALVIQASLGAVYIWSIFQQPLLEYFDGWTQVQVTYPAQIVLACFALGVILGGRLQDRLGPRLVATAGGVILSCGLVLASFAQLFEARTALAWLIMTYSVLGGFGIGIAYVCPIATCIKWFPDKRGLVTGLAVAGFGAGAFFLAPLARGLICGDAYAIFGVPLFPLPQIGVFNTLMTLGILFLVTVVSGAQIMRNPPPGYQPAGWTPPAKAGTASPVKADFTPSEMIRTRAFWVVWLTFFAGCTAGLMITMRASPIWQSFSFGEWVGPISQSTYLSVTAMGATAVSILALFNATGRVMWGKVSDMIDRRVTLLIMFSICAAALLALDYLREFPLYLLGIGLVALCFGGFLSVYAVVTADMFGTRNMGANYGLVFTAYGAGGIMGPYLAATLRQSVDEVTYLTSCPKGRLQDVYFVIGDYSLAFWVSAGACLIAAVLVLQIKHKSPAGAGATAEPARHRA